MGYRILYDNEKMQISKDNDKYFGKRMISFSLVCLLILGSLKMIGWDRIKNYLLPGEPEVTETAINSMIESIRTGASVKDAVTAFCVEIIEYAQ